MSLEKEFYLKMQNIMSILQNKEIPDTYPEYISKIDMRPFQNPYYIDRFEFMNISSFALVSKRWVKPLAEYIGDKKCLEVMAGNGCLSKCLSGYGVDIKATDNYTWKWHRSPENKQGQQLKREELWYDVEDLDCVESVVLYGKDAGYIICSWPPFKSIDLYKALIKMREINPVCKLIYIGEEKGGCTAEENFFNEARYIKNDKAFNEIASLFQSWPNMHDKIMLVK